MKHKLKIVLFIFCILIILGSKKNMKIVDYYDLGKEVEIIGRLYNPLGKILKLEGTVIYGDSTNEKGNEGRLLLKVDSIDGRMQQKIIIIPISIFGWSNAEAPKEGDHKKYIGY